MNWGLAVPTPVGVNRRSNMAEMLLIFAVPPPVGVNLRRAQSSNNCGRRPHARGGEPKLYRRSTETTGAVPTPVGVNLFAHCAYPYDSRRPHARGGEPI